MVEIKPGSLRIGKSYKAISKSNPQTKFRFVITDLNPDVLTTTILDGHPNVGKQGQAFYMVKQHWRYYDQRS